MSAVATAVQPVNVVLSPTREYPRELHVERSKGGYYWIGVVAGKRRKVVVAGVSASPGEIDVKEFSRSGSIAICIGGGSQFRITRAEADRLVAAFGFEVKKL